MKEIIVAIVALLMISMVRSDGPEVNEILKFPGYDAPLDFKAYSGFIQVSANRYLFYVFTQAVSDPANAPVVFWTNGGPGFVINII